MSWLFRRSPSEYRVMYFERRGSPVPCRIPLRWPESFSTLLQTLEAMTGTTYDGIYVQDASCKTENEASKGTYLYVACEESFQALIPRSGEFNGAKVQYALLTLPTRA